MGQELDVSDLCLLSHLEECAARIILSYFVFFFANKIQQDQANFLNVSRFSFYIFLHMFFSLSYQFSSVFIAYATLQYIFITTRLSRVPRICI